MSATPILSDLPEIRGPALVMGSSQSLSEFDCARFSGVRIGLGDLPWRSPELGPFDFWVCANNEFPLPWIRRHAVEIRRANAATICLATAMFGGMPEKPAERAVEKVASTISDMRGVIYDQRHTAGRYCTKIDGCCIAYAQLQVGPTIQEELHRRTPEIPQYVGSQSVAFHGIALAIILGAFPIYVAGVDLPQQLKSYLHVRPNRAKPQSTRLREIRHFAAQNSFLLSLRRPSTLSVFAENPDEMVSDLGILAAAALSLNTQIINTSPTSLLQNIDGIVSLR